MDIIFDFKNKYNNVNSLMALFISPQKDILTSTQEALNFIYNRQQEIKNEITSLNKQEDDWDTTLAWDKSYATREKYNEFSSSLEQSLNQLESETEIIKTYSRDVKQLYKKSVLELSEKFILICKNMYLDKNKINIDFLEKVRLFKMKNLKVCTNYANLNFELEQLSKNYIRNIIEIKNVKNKMFLLPFNESNDSIEISKKLIELEEQLYKFNLMESQPGDE